MKNKFKLTEELKKLYCIIVSLDRKTLIIFIGVSVLQTISWYYTSRRFFKFHLLEHYSNTVDASLVEYLYWFAGDFVTLFILPALVVKILFKERLADYGLTFGDTNAGLKIAALFLAIMIPVIWYVSATQNFSTAYPQLEPIKDSWRLFLIYELGLIVYMFAWEFIWRGFMLFGLEKKFGYYAVLIQMIPFVILHNGKPVLEVFGAIAAGIALGILAFRTRSIYYGIITHLGVMLSIDLFSTLRYRANDYGVGLSSLVNITKELFK